MVKNIAFTTFLTFVLTVDDGGFVDFKTELEIIRQIERTLTSSITWYNRNNSIAFLPELIWGSQFYLRKPKNKCWRKSQRTKELIL